MTLELPVKRPYPSIRKTKHADLRGKIDSIALDTVRVLEDAYYGTCLSFDAAGKCLARDTDGWRHEVTHQIIIDGTAYQMLGTPALSQAQFDKLHGMVWETHRLCLYLQNEVDGKPYGDLHIKEKWEADLIDPDNIRRRVLTDLKVETADNMKRTAGAIFQAVPLSLRAAFRLLVP